MKIITDSTADLPRETYEREEIGVVPLTYPSRRSHMV